MGNTSPLVSIIINNYNYGSFLGQAIDSALDQNYKNVEVIVVDDGSQDNSRSIISSYGNRIIPVLKENGGQASAFNAGFSNSSGDIICFLDADDLVFQNRAEQVVRLFTTYPEIEWFFHESAPIDSENIAQITLSNIQAKHPKSSEETHFEIIDFRDNLRNAVLPHFAPSTSNLCFTRTLLNKFFPLPEVKGHSGLAICDVYLRTVAVWLGIGIKSEEYLGVFRFHESNLYTTQGITKKRRTYCEILLFTAYYLLLNYPELSRLGQKLLSKGICLHWNVRNNNFNYDNIISKSQSKMSYLVRSSLYIRATLYSMKLKFSDLV
ncbi:glycosyltransferase family 2 protein [Leptothoe sp. PORK10 BA2]|uniref:glycosyltransferase family 2 protein n=1 Tax=Leptothoe sp. PORK10 BA2 TaxID=3110254 RepID=UPI002B21DDF2|nr:glycosyltransferase family 2 protein [Leptothoe sp. PORK10 BA2]MEA5466111.1 glycosyltransferase family 2 protein [Leptothoe sp. PORK10 BA2]